MRTAHKVGATLVLVAIGAGGFYAQGTSPHAGVEPSGGAPRLPHVAITDTAAITRIEITEPETDAEADSEAAGTTVLEKRDGRWYLTSPLHARASASKISEALANLAAIEVTQGADCAGAAGAECGLSDAEAVHVVAFQGALKAADLYFGRTGRAGRFLRIGGGDGAFVVPASGSGSYSGFLYTRSPRNWRETSILAFDQRDVVDVEITNTNGHFLFHRAGGTWTGSFAARDARGALRAPEPDWAAFDPGKVDEFLGTYKSLAADDFGDESQRANSGVDSAEETGGVVRIKRREGADRVVRVGKLSTNSGRWAIQGSRWAIDDEGDGSLFALAPWTARWALAGASSFERAGEGGATEPALAFSSPTVDLNVAFGQTGSEEVRLVGRLASSARLRVSAVRPPGPDVRILPGDKDRAQGVRIAKVGDQVGHVAGQVTLATGLDSPAELTLLYSWTVLGTMSVEPTNPFLDLRAERPEVVLRVRSNRKDFHLDEARAVDGPFEATFEREPSSGDYLVHVRALGRDSVDAGERGFLGKVRLMSNDPAEPRKDVPVFALGPLKPPALSTP